MLELNKIYNMDCLEGMKLLDDKSIDLTVTSPPYDNLRTYNGFTFDFEGIAKELYRVTKDGGVVVWVVGDATINGSETGTSFKQALYFKEIGFNLHDTMIWRKPNPLPTLAKNRYTGCFEYMFIFSRGVPIHGAIRQIPSKNADKEYRVRRNNATSKGGGGVSTKDKVYTTKATRNDFNIWEIAPAMSFEYFNHPAQFPEALASDHIISWSNKDDIVLDPFMGSGTTGKMAYQNNRNYIGFEISKEYCDIANKRIDDVKAQIRMEF